jgi:6-phosphofructokinase 1
MRIAISTGGGDAPGLNAVIRGATLAAIGRGWDVVGIRDSFDGLMLPRLYPNGDGLINLTKDKVRAITHLGGTILGSTNRGDPTVAIRRAGDSTGPDRAIELVGMFRDAGIDALITIGGDGSLRIGQKLADAGLRVISVPKTIDNDLGGTDATFGFDTAVEIATESIGRLFTTATSHSRIFVVEVMGRNAGWIALNSGIASGAHAVLIPEIPFDLDTVAAMVTTREQLGSRFAIIVVAEGAWPIGGTGSIIATSGDGTQRFSGVGELVACELQRRTGKDARTVVLGHLLRGGTPSAFDRLLGLRFGAAAVRAIDDGRQAMMVSLRQQTIEYVELASAISSLHTVPLDCDTIACGRELGVCFGD